MSRTIPMDKVVVVGLFLIVFAVLGNLVGGGTTQPSPVTPPAKPVGVPEVFNPCTTVEDGYAPGIAGDHPAGDGETSCDFGPEGNPGQILERERLQREELEFRESQQDWNP